MDHEIKTNRRAFLRTAVLGMAPQASGLGPLKMVKADVLDGAYHESGPADGFPVVLLHGVPFDPMLMPRSRPCWRRGVAA